MSLEWEKLNETPIKAGWRSMLDREFRLPDGRTDTYTVKAERETVCILALTPGREVILAKQYRPGPEQVVAELPGGGLEAGEAPLEAAARELLEETGYAGEVRLVCTALDCGYSTMRRHCFVATDCRKVAEPSPDDNEFIETVVLPMAEFRTLLRSGQLTDVEVGYLGLDALGLL
jgi:ADP-ribose pyrophosphatase